MLRQEPGQAVVEEFELWSGKQWLDGVTVLRRGCACAWNKGGGPTMIPAVHNLHNERVHKNHCKTLNTAGGGGGMILLGIISPGENFTTLETPNAQSATCPNDCNKTRKAQERDSKVLTHCHNIVTEVLPKSHQERHLKAQVCVSALCTVTALCTATSRGRDPPNFIGENFASILDGEIFLAKLSPDNPPPPPVYSASSIYTRSLRFAVPSSDLPPPPLPRMSSGDETSGHTKGMALDTGYTAWYPTSLCGTNHNEQTTVK